MATIKIYLDKRNEKANGEYPLKISINHRSKTAYIPLNINLAEKQWDGSYVIKHKNAAQLNNFIMLRKSQIHTTLLELELNQKTGEMSATEIKDYIIQKLTGKERIRQKKEEANLFMNRFTRFAETRNTPGTRGLYAQTFRRMQDFDKDLPNLKFEDITREWLKNFELFLAKTSKSANARGIHLRNIRAVFNDAIDDEVTNFYPFRRFKIKTQQTSSRALPIDILRRIINTEVEPCMEKYRDLFVLMFLLCGINTIDLLNLKNCIGDRIEYQRKKTGKFVSIKVESEAAELINRYRGKEMLLQFLDGGMSYEAFRSRFNKNLKNLGTVEVGKHGTKIRKPIFPELSAYWARHTWATIAAELDIPRETIGAALSHSTNSVTDIYINFNRKKIDEANRKVIDYVYYDKR